MGTTIIGPRADDVPYEYAPPIIEVASIEGDDSGDWWINDFEVDEDLELVSMGLYASSSQVSQCSIRYRYGQVKQPSDGDFVTLSARSLEGSWIRVSLPDPNGGDPIVQFIGRLDSESRNMFGDQDYAAGIQEFQVTGGLKILQKITVRQAYFDNGNLGTSLVGWLPSINKKDRRGLMVGNRSKDRGGTSYNYGGTDLWTHYDYLEYLIANFVQGIDGSGLPAWPQWTIGGQADILKNIKTTIDLGESATAAQILGKLIPVRYGLDYMVTPTDTGFEITVFALSKDNIDFSVDGETQTMTGNPNTVEVQRVGQHDLIDVKLAVSYEKKYDKIEIVGKRIVVCGTLYGEYYGVASLVPKWSNDLESQYKSAGGDDPDATRKNSDKFRNVYQYLGAPENWDLDGKAWCIEFDDNGKVVQGTNFQNSIRETLSWVPMKEGFDYSVDPPIDNTETDMPPDMKHPLAWIYDEQPVGNYDNPRLVKCDAVGIHVSRPYNDWGVFLSASFNHKLALNHWNNDEIYSSEYPEYDYTMVIATIAIESDQRIRLVKNVPYEAMAYDGSVMRVFDNEAECWVMLDQTVVDIDENGEQVKWTGGLRELRNDIDRLTLLMAGLIGRYTYERGRASLTFKGILPRADLLGSIMTTITQGGEVIDINAPITSIEWSGTSGGKSNSPQLVMKTGYA
ncbi:MAG: hypothetical protein FWD61_12085 [Phycisphaerales bacterium]|nr:hypothetical protein [Phycisphaerales bacterium]